MNINATEADLRNAAEVLKMAAILDDRAPGADKARIAAWAEKIHTHRLERDDLLDALQDFYDRGHDRAIGIGDLIETGRRIKRDRLDREAEAERERRQTDQEFKADVDNAIAAVSLGLSRRETSELRAAREALGNCHNRETAMAAMRQFAAARKVGAK